MLPVLQDAQEHNRQIWERAENEERQQREQLQLLMKYLRDSSDVFSFPTRKFISEFRLNKYLVRYLIDTLKEVLPSKRRDAIPLEIKVFSTLCFLATGTYQRVTGQIFYLCMSQSSMSRILHEIVDAIYSYIVDKWIVFPNTDRQKQELSNDFEAVMGVPNIFAAVDGTLVKILAPRQQEYNYVDRKGNHSKNIMIVCDYTRRVLAINAKFGGSSNDAYIWSQSKVLNEMREQYNNGSKYMILGDSGYPLQPWLMTPLPGAREGTPEYRYTYHHSRARSCVERCIGCIKNRFRCISSDNVMRYDPSFVGRIITVAACLHNMCIHEGLNIEDCQRDIRNDHNNQNEDENDIEDIQNEDEVYYADGNQRRQYQIAQDIQADILQRYFS